MGLSYVLIVDSNVEEQRVGGGGCMRCEIDYLIEGARVRVSQWGVESNVTFIFRILTDIEASRKTSMTLATLNTQPSKNDPAEINSPHHHPHLT
eukprot:scaffold27858_cov143-Skeletonema_menzelii.AAC.2